MATGSATLERNAAGRADPVNGALRDFKESREGARRHHAEAIGKDVNPTHCFGDFLVRVAKHDTDGITKEYGRTLIPLFGSVLASETKAALSVEGGGPTGGYLVPPELRDDLMRDVWGTAAFRPRATIVPMSSATIDLPMPDATTVPSASGVAPYWGGMQMQFNLEGEARTETEPKFRQLELRAADLGGFVVISNPTMKDGLALEAWLRVMFARSLAWYEDWFFINGTGSGQPQGVISSTAATTVNRNVASHFKTVDAQSMVAQLYELHGGVWMMSRAAGADLTSLTNWIPNGPMILHGMEIFITLKQPALGTKGDVILTDPSMYVIGDRGAVSVEKSDSAPTYFQNNQCVWRIVERVDGQPWLNKPVTIPDGGSTTVSPIVVLV